MMERLILSLLFVAPVLVTKACDMNIQLSCHETYLEPLDNITTGSAEFCSQVKAAVPNLKNCFQDGMQGCSDENKAQLQTILDAYLKGYSAYDALCQGNHTMPIPNFPNPANCPEFMKCFEEVYKSLGIDPTDGLTQEEQAKLSIFGDMSGVTNPSAVCPFTSKIRIGTIMECMQAASKKCSMPDPLEGLVQIFQGQTDMGSQMKNQMPMGGFMAPVTSYLKLVKSDGTINGTAWDIMFAYMCDKACKGKLESADTLFSTCDFGEAPPTVGPGQDEAEICSEYQDKVDCATKAVGECPVLILMLHAYIKPLASQILPNCDLKISKPPPTIPPSLRDSETYDNSAQTLAISTQGFMILFVATFLL